jgi:hypothetical protein
MQILQLCCKSSVTGAALEDLLLGSTSWLALEG